MALSSCSPSLSFSSSAPTSNSKILPFNAKITLPQNVHPPSSHQATTTPSLAIHIPHHYHLSFRQHHPISFIHQRQCHPLLPAYLLVLLDTPPPATTSQDRQQPYPPPIDHQRQCRLLLPSYFFVLPRTATASTTQYSQQPIPWKCPTAASALP